MNETKIIDLSVVVPCFNEAKVLPLLVSSLKGNLEKTEQSWEVLLVDDGKDTTIGTPYILGAKIDAEIVKIGRSRKVLVVKYKQKSRFLRRNGHRHPFFQVKINSIK